MMNSLENENPLENGTQMEMNSPADKESAAQMPVKESVEPTQEEVAKARQIIADAEAVAEETLTAADAMAEEVLAKAETMAEEALAKAEATAKATVAEAKATAKATVTEAEAVANATISEAKARAKEALAAVETLARSTYNDAKVKAQTVCAEANDKAEKILADAKAEADKTRREAQTWAKEYVAQVRERENKTLADAGVRAQLIQSDAMKTAAKLIQSAKEESQRLSETRRSVELGMYKSNHAEIMGKFTSMSSVMMELNDIMRATQEMLTQTHTQTVFRQLYDLYSLIADNRDSLSQRSDYDENMDLQISCGNLEEFMYMITEYLSEFGIETIATQAGAPFEGKYHAAVGNRNFNPASARIAKSLRCGFVWDQVVLAKEKVTVC